MNYLPSKLLKLRKHYNYSQAHLAELLKVDVMEYMAYENGRKIPSYEECQTIANLYHISIDEIIKNSDEVTLYNVSSSRTDEINIEYFLPKKIFINSFGPVSANANKCPFDQRSLCLKATFKLVGCSS